MPKTETATKPPLTPDVEVEIHELNRDDIADLLPRLKVVEEVLWAAEGMDIDTGDDFFVGVANIVGTIREDIKRLISSDVAFSDTKKADEALEKLAGGPQ